VTYTAIDYYYSTVCQFSVNVFDFEPPVATNCVNPPDITVNAAPGSCSASVTVNSNNPSWTDNCAISSISTSPQGSGTTTYSVGITPISSRACDTSGNCAVCEYTVEVVDTTAPTLTTCPPNVQVQSSCNDAGTTATWAEPLATGDCLSGIHHNHSPGDTFPDGYTTVTYVVTEDQNFAACSFLVYVVPCESEAPIQRPPGAFGSIDQDGDGYFADAPLGEWRDCCDSVMDGCADPYMTNPGAFEIPANGQIDSCRGLHGVGSIPTTDDFDIDFHVNGCDAIRVAGPDFSLIGPTNPSTETEKVVWAMDICEFKDDDDDPSWGFYRQQSLIFSLANGTRNGYDIGIFGPNNLQANINTRYGNAGPARGEYLLAISTGNSADLVTSPFQTNKVDGVGTGNSIVNPPGSFLAAGGSGFTEACPSTPPGLVIDSIRTYFDMVQPTNMNGFSFQAMYFDAELERRQGSYPGVSSVCSETNFKSHFVAMKIDSDIGTGNFASDSAGNSFNSFNNNPDFWTKCNNFNSFGSQCYDGTHGLDFTGFSGGTPWIPIGSSARPGERFGIEFATWDSSIFDTDVVVLIDDFYPITEARTKSSVSGLQGPRGYQFSADVAVTSLIAVGGNLQSSSVSQVQFMATLTNFGPKEEANDVYLSFTPPIGMSFSSARDGSGNAMTCTNTVAITNPDFANNAFYKCRFNGNPTMNVNDNFFAFLTFNVNLGCNLCPNHIDEIAMRVTATHSSIDRELSNNYRVEMVYLI